MNDLIFEINKIDFIQKNKILDQFNDIQILQNIAEQTNDYHHRMNFCHEFYLLLCQLTLFKLTDQMKMLHKFYNSGMNKNTSLTLLFTAYLHYIQ